MQNDNKFSFTYSAPTERERREIESIKRQYAVDGKGENKIERLRKLHNKVITPATIVSLVFGVIGTLIFGLGMSLVLEFGMLVLGIIVCVLGLPLIILAYPMYNIVLRAGKVKYGEEILRLSDELLSDEAK